VGKPEGKNHLKDPGVAGRIILRWIFRKLDVGGVNWIELAQDKNRCECGNENSGSIKYGNLLTS
jgi:hypothetical protein